jgi:ABC-type spermidine/putrescine transport system permease subunit I
MKPKAVVVVPSCTACLLAPVGVVLAFYGLALFGLFRLSVAPVGAAAAPAVGWLTLAHFRKALFDDIYLRCIVTTFTISTYVTLAAVVLGYLIAYKIVRTPSRLVRTVLVLSIAIPFLTNIIVRMYAMSLVLSNTGLVNTLLQHMGLLAEGAVFPMVRNRLGVTIGLVSFTLPFVTFVMTTAFRRLDATLEEAAGSLGAGPITTFVKVTLPLSLPGVIGGAVLAFILSVSAFVTPLVLGQGNVRMIANAVYDLVMFSENKPLGAALSMIALVLTLAVLYLQKLLTRGGPRHAAA